jgi:hypothetical protein
MWLGKRPRGQKCPSQSNSYSRQDHRNVKMSGVSVLNSNWSEMSVRFMLSHHSATICKMTTSAALDGIRFHPRITHYNSGRVVPIYTITFQRYADLCKVIGVTCTGDATDTLIKIKKEKRNNAPIVIRLLGCLRNFSSSNDGPMFLSVGHGCNPPESECNNLFHVLFRKSK